jgi:hypothetical protein
MFPSALGASSTGIALPLTEERHQMMRALHEPHVLERGPLPAFCGFFGCFAHDSA